MKWIDKYSPSGLKDIVGQDLSNFKRSVLQTKPILLHGSSGTGKTSSVYALAKELDYEVLEVNTADVRNKNLINSIIGSAIKQRSLFSKGKIILLDDIDGLSGVKDRGGATALAKLLGESKYPIIMTANDPYDAKLRTIRTKSVLIEFNLIRKDIMFSYLKEILMLENVKFDDVDLLDICEHSKGDLRVAMQEMESLIVDNVLVKGSEDRIEKKNIFGVLREVFFGEDVLNVLIDNNVKLDDWFLWLEENMARGCFDFGRGFDFLSKADVFRGRIRRWQHWRFLVYINYLLTSGVNSLEGRECRYGKPNRVFKMWMAKQKNLKKKSIAEKFSSKIHCSRRKVMEYMPYMKYLIRKEGVVEDLELNEEEVDWIVEKG